MTPDNTDTPYRNRPKWADEVEPLHLLPGEDGAPAALARLMSEVSEETWCAGWMMGLEDSLWLFCESVEAHTYGMSAVSADDVRALRLLAVTTGGWVEWADGDGPTLDDDLGGEGPRFVAWLDSSESTS